MNEATMGYTAGIIDGEGCINIYYQSYAPDRGYKRHRLQLIVANTNYHLMAWFRDHWGGKVYKCKRCKPHHATPYQWRLWGKAAGKFLEQLLPYLVLKGRQAEIAIQFRGTIGKRGSQLKEGVIEKRHQLMKEINKLNKKGGN